MQHVYLDNNATTPLDPAVIEAMEPFFSRKFGNASSIHAFGQEARAAVESARQQVANLLGARPQEVVFTSGGTESDNFALWGVTSALKARGRHIVTSQIEHPAVLRMCGLLEGSGFRVTYLGVDETGRISLDELSHSLAPDTVLVSVMAANNETGVIQPVEEISQLLKGRDILFHTDAVQWAGKIPLDVRQLGVDLLSISAHKMHGPKGVGALVIREGLQLAPLIVGGSHERSRRGGTENVPGIVGLGMACELAQDALPDFNTRVRALRDQLENEIIEEIPDTVLNGHATQRLPHVSNISFAGIQGEALLIALDIQGIAVSTGAACAAGTVSPSHVLTAMGLPSQRVNGAIRFSLGRMSKRREIVHVLEVLPGLVRRMRQASPLSRSG